MKHSNKKSKKHKRFDDHELDSDEKNADGNENTEYDIEASDDEFDEVPSKWFDEVISSSLIIFQVTSAVCNFLGLIFQSSLM